jgi:hypothetical protein
MTGKRDKELIRGLDLVIQRTRRSSGKLIYVNLLKMIKVIRSGHWENRILYFQCVQVSIG